MTADYILPFSDATVDEVRKLLADGTIHGDPIGAVAASLATAARTSRLACASGAPCGHEPAHGAANFAVSAMIAIAFSRLEWNASACLERY